MEKALKLKEKKQGQAMQTLQLQDSHHSQDKPPNQGLTTITPHVERLKSPPEDQVKLAATAITLNVRLRSSDMPAHMQNHALRHTRTLLDSAAAAPPAAPKARPNPTHLARALKKEFDSVYGPAWHCVVGTSFGSFVTHSPGGFVYFSVDDSLSVLLFKTEVQLVKEKPQPAQTAKP
ncbi:hypothetical protein PRUPE_4G183100 [Prunus persica]|uniref:Dynein light chain n=1 Tax=Prunus persica TaxID=3760 RepID=M5WPI6_PRUPE|nr:uncharacterized protein LOC18780556 [Prunus persica]ONI12779.1 hypothetical protein PRUPE_4G183100 [Prunus persica]